MVNGKKRIAVFASGNGSNFQALIEAVQAGEINGEIVALVTSKRHAYAATRARNAKIEVLLFEPENLDHEHSCAKTAKALNDRNVDLVCLAGYMMKLEPCMVRSFPNRIINIHPALLPKYGGQGMYGRKVHEAVIASKEKESGCTVHVVDEIYDHGAILAQSKVTVDPTDTQKLWPKKFIPKNTSCMCQLLKKFATENSMISRYTRDVMAQIWTDELTLPSVVRNRSFGRRSPFQKGEGSCQGHKNNSRKSSAQCGTNSRNRKNRQA